MLLKWERGFLECRLHRKLILKKAGKKFKQAASSDDSSMPAQS
jgi:hypothetical protein